MYPNNEKYGSIRLEEKGVVRMKGNFINSSSRVVFIQGEVQFLNKLVEDLDLKIGDNSRRQNSGRFGC